MDAVELHALTDGEGGGGEGGFEAVVGGGESGEEVAEDGFAGNAEKDGAAEFVQGVQIAEEGDVLRLGFGEADAGIEDDAIGGHAGGGGDV